jgi:hypothetical protein
MGVIDLSVEEVEMWDQFACGSHDSNCNDGNGI